jgi:hypothetical protein
MLVGKARLRCLEGKVILEEPNMRGRERFPEGNAVLGNRNLMYISKKRQGCLIQPASGESFEAH